MNLDFGQVELIDAANDQSVGRTSKLAAHQSGAFHRAISVLLVDASGRHILQRRASGKYHCAGLWANACCSHPAPGEASSRAATRRLQQELGVSCALYRLGTLRYRAQVPALPTVANPDGMLVENERVALFCGLWDGKTRPDPAEVWETAALTQAEALATPTTMQAPWLRLYLQTFGAELPSIVKAAAYGEWTPRDFGRIELATHR